MTPESDIIAALKQILDPELQVDVWTLGLIYKIEQPDDKTINITMTFTTTACPYGPALVDMITGRMKAIPGVENSSVNVVFEPPWQPSEDLKMMWGV